MLSQTDRTITAWYERWIFHSLMWDLQRNRQKGLGSSWGLSVVSIFGHPSGWLAAGHASVFPQNAGGKLSCVGVCLQHSLCEAIWQLKVCQGNTGMPLCNLSPPLPSRPSPGQWLLVIFLSFALLLSDWITCHPKLVLGKLFSSSHSGIPLVFF